MTNSALELKALRREFVIMNRILFSNLLPSDLAIRVPVEQLTSGSMSLLHRYS